MNRTDHVALAYGGFLMFISVTQYLRYNTRYFVLVGTLRRGLPPILRFFIGTTPIYVGFMMFGVVMFGDIATRFDGSLNASVTLFAVRNCIGFTKSSYMFVTTVFACVDAPQHFVADSFDSAPD